MASTPSVYHEFQQRRVAPDAIAERYQQTSNYRYAFQPWPVIVATMVEHFDMIEAEFDGDRHT